MTSPASRSASPALTISRTKNVRSSRSENFPNFSTRVEEENRNRDYITLLGSVDFALFGQAFATFTYEHDQAFDERDTGDTVRLQLRVPL